MDKIIFLNKTVEIALYAKITDGFNLVIISQIMVFDTHHMCDGTICDLLQFVTAARFVTTKCFNLWPGTICDQKCFNLWPALYNDFRVQVVQGKTCFCVYTYNECNMIEYDAYIYIWTVL